MRKNLAQLAERRERLVAQAAAQRTALAESIEPWRTPLAWADRGLEMLSVLKRHPVWLVGGVAAFAALRVNRAGKWLRRGWVTWQVVQKLRGR
ncbi:MAG: YqjK-like family protein [Gammaproteobacteria bacterium]|nr:YqjK-like family protein [Gammaproteobacteria bacterium]